MIDTTHILLYTVIIALTIMMVIIGWQFYQILGEIRKMLGKANLMMDNSMKMVDNFGKSFQSLNGFTDGVKAALNIFKFFKKDDKKNE
jgi:hypothetical protein